MSLQEINLPSDPALLPDRIRAWVEEANCRTDEFYDSGLGLRYPKYIQSDPRVVYTAMAFLKENNHLRGNVFCEWGSGFAIASGIATLLGMKSFGIEIEEELVTRARKLLSDCNLPVEILEVDYLPEGYEESEGHGGKDLISPESTTPRGGEVLPPEYDGLDPSEVDLFFVYPWPDQEEMMLDLFSEVSSDGAILLMYLGDGEIAAFVKDEDDPL